MSNVLDRYVGATAYDPAGNKIGKIKELFIDARTQQPKWVAVNTGFLGTSESLVPMAGAKQDGDSVTVAVDKERVKDAPHFSVGDHIDPQQESELARHYHLQGGQPPQSSGKHELAGPAPAAPAATAPAGLQDPHLRDHGRRADMRPSATDTPEANGTGGAMIRSEERLDVGTEKAEAGTVRLVKYVFTEQKTVDVPVTHEEVRVEREPITDASTVRDSDIGEAEQQVTLHEDRVVVDKHSVPVERVRMRVDEVTEDKRITEQVRKEQIKTEGLNRPNR
ncbi:PRC and DUF2382 domain-containing protein [Mycolicibacterium brisbanense]|uniref:DUF2382 domain-containing protein n=1 Tax=Mycolicibacterium brisbanense TaxID=146020 RepID=A0A100VVE5_9MYCO|nr:PRC and DUF2382 domain-containing protein [Mycolicibacterium brisbanense]MCV7160839.1 PRC and DUF2382 domain-containing protein [Mycolicibacterium brisbanense]GAS86754.1 uncharacterized protein RMCB_0850 [Mycolicibacterium brisbanense]